MDYTEAKPCTELEPFIHSFWELKGNEHDGQWERIFPDGCAGVVVNLGDDCLTDNGSVTMEFGKTYAVGAMTSFKDSFIGHNTHLVGVCHKPASFANFYTYAPQNELTNNTVEFEKSLSFKVEKVLQDPLTYLNQYFVERVKNERGQIHSIVDDVHLFNGQLRVYELSKRNRITIRQLERIFKTHIGISPKEYSSIIRFQNALRIIKDASHHRSLLDIAFACGFYDHSHLTNEIKRNTGLTPSQL